MGPLPLAYEANLFFRLISARYERGSIVLTSNKHVRDWPEIFAGDEVLATAILDRLLRHVHVVHIDGGSYHAYQEAPGTSSGGSELGYASLTAP